MQDIFNALNFNPSTFLLMAVNIFIVMFILNKFLYKPVSSIMQQREDNINKEILEAAEARKSAALERISYQEQLRTAKREAARIVENATRIGEEMKQRIIDDAKIQADSIVMKAKREIADEKERAYIELQRDVSGMVIDATRQILKREISVEEHQQLINNFLKGAGKVQ